MLNKTSREFNILEKYISKSHLNNSDEYIITTLTNLAQELNNVKGHIGQLTMISRPPTPFPFNNVNNDIKFSHEKIAQNDEPEQESMEYEEDESEEYSEDDERIIALNQKGVNSNHYVPGPLSNMEWGIKAFHAGYLKQLGEKTNINS